MYLLREYPKKSIYNLLRSVSWYEFEKKLDELYPEERADLPFYKKMFFDLLNAKKVEGINNFIFYLDPIVEDLNDDELDELSEEDFYIVEEELGYPYSDEELSFIVSCHTTYDKDVELKPEHDDTVLLLVLFFEIVYGDLLMQISPFVDEMIDQLEEKKNQEQKKDDH